MYRKHLFVIRKGQNGVIESAQDVIRDAGLQDDVHQVDETAFGFTLVGEDEDVKNFTNRFIGKWSLSIVKASYLPDYSGVVVLGKLMDGALHQRGQDMARKLF